MSDFSLYFQLGLEHIADLRAFDHMIFIISLCVIFRLQDWRKVLVLVTAFTIGHSLTLVLSALDVINIDRKLIEILIPITILITCILNIIIVYSEKSYGTLRLHYFLALFFGFIHGLGFANYLTALLMGEDTITLPLLAFNLGIEVGQIAIVVLFFGLTAITQKLTYITPKNWVLFISILIALTSIFLLFQQF